MSNLTDTLHVTPLVFIAGGLLLGLIFERILLVRLWRKCVQQLLEFRSCHYH